VRIIAGEHRGRRIAAPEGESTRPMLDRVRESLFGTLGERVEGAQVLDLFAGSGSLALEALSRGAERAVFVEADADAARAIERNLDKLRLTGATVVRRDARTALASEAAAGRTYDLVLVDPPYEAWSELERSLAPYLAGVLAPDGLLVVETAARTEPALPLALRTSRRYGSARLTLYEREP
jgi:16S rRNA (guanine966-N2)-methyltransferase